MQHLLLEFYIPEAWQKWIIATHAYMQMLRAESFTI